MGVRQTTEATLCLKSSRSTCSRYILSTLKEEATYKEEEAILMMEATMLVIMFLLGMFVGIALRPQFDAAWESLRGDGVPFVPFI